MKIKAAADKHGRARIQNKKIPVYPRKSVDEPGGVSRLSLCPCDGGCPRCTGAPTLSGGGQPLPQPTRDFMESRFNRDFSHVRIHTGADAAETAGSLNARAFTTGRHVVFGTGAYSPGTAEGKQLLAHELTHVVQQEHFPSTAGYIRRKRRKLKLTVKPWTRKTHQLRTKPTCKGKKDITQLIKQVAKNAAQLINSADISATEKQRINHITAIVFSDEPPFSMKTFKFATCESIYLSYLPRELSSAKGYADRKSREIVMLEYFKDDALSFINNRDIEALHRLLEIIAHEKRHITISGAPTIGKGELKKGNIGKAGLVAYFVEEILTRAEEIATNAVFYGRKYKVDVDTQQTIYFIRNNLERLLTPLAFKKVRAYIHEELRIRFSRNPSCDNAISVGVLSAMDKGVWYGCSRGKVLNIPDGAKICSRGNRHSICPPP